MSQQHFDIAVVGAGPGGYIAALKAAQMGAKVAIVEQGHLGGTCLNNGCIPSKALLASAELLHSIENAPTLGVSVQGGVSFDWAHIQKRKDKVLATLRGGIKALFGARKVSLFQGRGKLDGAGRIAIASDGGDARQITADKTILATGSTPSRIPGWPDDPLQVCTSDEALHWSELPGRLLIVGGGVIGCEFACMMQPLGVDVTVVEMMPRLLPEMDAELAGALAKIFAKRKIRCLTDTKVTDLGVADDALRAELSSGESLTVDKVLVATGRRPATDDLGLDSIGVTTDRGFIRVNDKMETSAGNVYCIGDANGRCLLAHAASAHGVAAVKNALGGSESFQSPIPWCVYTFPEIAGVGLTGQQAEQQGLPVSMGMFPLGHLGKAMATAHTEGFVKIVRHRETDQLLGVHMIGHNATEVIAAAATAMDRKVTTHELAEIVFAHPTVSEAVKESAEDALNAALHLPPRKVLSVMAGMQPQ